MKTITITLITTLMFGFLSMAQVKVPAPSPTQTLKQDFALSSIEVNYSRPSKKSRVIFGDLVPYGKPWRTGANTATKVTFGEDVKVGGTAVKAGTYALYTIPGNSEWEVMLNKGTSNWGVNGYNATEDVAKFKIKSNEMEAEIETFTIEVGNITANSATLDLYWDKTTISIPVVADIDSKIMASIDKAMNVDTKPYFESATYYYEAGKDLPKALEWAGKASDANPKAYWIMLLKAKIQAKMGDKVGAKATSMKSMQAAKEGGNADYVALNEKLQATLK